MKKDNLPIATAAELLPKEVIQKPWLIERLDESNPETRMVTICNPNNLTGTIVSSAQNRAVLKERFF